MANVGRRVHGDIQLTESAQSKYSSPFWEKYFTWCVPLQKAAIKGDWATATALLPVNPSWCNDSITLQDDTVLHIAALQGHASFVAGLLNMNGASALVNKTNKKGYTALLFAAASGNVDIANRLMTGRTDLLTISEGVSPLYIAALLGHNEMADNLIGRPTGGDQVASSSRGHELAISIKDLPADSVHFVAAAEKVLKKASFFDMIYFSCFCLHETLKFMSESRFKKKKKKNAFSFSRKLKFLQEISFVGIISKLLFVAAESGNEEFLIKLIDRYPDILYHVNNLKRSIFHIAVLNRHVQIFNLIYELGNTKDLIATFIDKDGNNLLHLAAMLAPQNQLNGIHGAALQMQREVLWYKEVEKIVPPSYRNKKNSANQTPYELFLAKHENLMRKGEKQMKQIANSCMLVAILIVTVMFTSTFTVPGGYNNSTGAPVLQNNKLFMVLPISEAVATLSSFASMLMFLSILTSRYSADDFQKSLPIWLVIGVITLFVSIVAMMVAFCTCLLFYHGLAAITILLILFASVPIMFIILNYPLLVAIVRCTYSSRWLFRSNKRLFS
ncbi:hypothetical protein Pfo_015764 [Paulownia fortunei]|nr:hypothetical protein Pfo_015764 [Paulownia fortunei]